MDTPWGRSDHKQTLINGVVSVDTPSHGGLMIQKDVANKLLTPQAIQKGMSFGDYLCYEEDCDIAIPVYEIAEIREQLYKEDAENRLMMSLSLWNADYLIARGLTPLAKQYERFKKSQELYRK